MGYDAVWLAETSGPDSFSLAAAIATITQRMEIGTAIVPVYNRTPAVLAMSAATLAELSGGRFVLGLGTSSHAIMDAWNGVPLERPLAAVRDAVAICRQALAGERTDYAGEVFHSKGFRVGGSPPQPVPIYLAGLREKMLQLAGELGDGVIVNLFPRAALPQIVSAYRAGAERGDRESGPVVCRHQVGITDDIPEARARVRSSFAGYFATPVYNRFLRWCGFEGEMSKIADGFAARDRDAVRDAMHDDFVDEIAILGDLESCHAKLASFVEGGVTTTVLSPLAASRDESLAVYEAFAPSARQ
ncbi:MAG: LLM class flavin-dependent oxidoreductase [Myxococcales bacterium]|nr:LLM class flavin-dependent oxidoreductase [Myxococcales bacterium]